MPDEHHQRAIFGTFEIERHFGAPPRSVFDAWAKPEAKGRWFAGPPDEWTLTSFELDFRPGGQEILEGRFGVLTTRYNALYHVIEDVARIVYVYDMSVGGVHVSISLATVEIEADGEGTRMTYTEQSVYLDGKDGTESRRYGTGALFDRLHAILPGQRETGVGRRAGS